jgi:hypothetical protein
MYFGAPATGKGKPYAEEGRIAGTGFLAGNAVIKFSIKKIEQLCQKVQKVKAARAVAVATAVANPRGVWHRQANVQKRKFPERVVKHQAAEEGAAAVDAAAVVAAAENVKHN